jgi:hypothetical protein
VTLGADKRGNRVMAYHSHRVRSVTENGLPAVSYREWSAPLRGFVRRTMARVRPAVAGLMSRLSRVSPDHWFLLGFALLFFLFLIILVVQPSSVGRGGR